MKPGVVLALCALCATVAFGIAALGLRAFDRRPPAFAVVDLTGLVRKQQERAIRAMADPLADEATKRAALASAGEFGKRADAAVVALSQECACVLLVREAVVSGQVEDLTPRLAARLDAR